MDHRANGIDVAAIAETIRPMLDGTAELPGGLRDRKKRLLRQLISDTATEMFLERGFNEVTVREVAEACDVSEKTIFNYFPTKESLLLDREEYQAALIREALRDRGDEVSIVDGVLAVLEADATLSFARWAELEVAGREPDLLRRFAALIEETPSLQAAMNAMMERLTQVAAQALAERAGVDPEDPEPQIAAMLVIGLWNAELRAMHRYVDGTRSPEEMRTLVMDEVRRAARVADSGLSSFNLVVHTKAGTRDQLREAAMATNEARKQVVAAVKKARDAWKVVVAEMKAHHEADEAVERSRREERRTQQQQQRAEISQQRREIRERQIQAHRDRNARNRGR